MADQKLTQHFETKGAEEAAQKVQDVADANAQVGDAVNDAKPKVDSLSDATENLIGNEEAFKGVLQGLSPQLAAVANALLDGTKLAGQFGAANVSVTGIVTAAKAAVLKYKDAMLLLGAGGAAFIAIQAMIKEWEKLRQEIEDTVAIMERFQEPQRAREQRRGQTRREVVEHFAAAKPTATDEDIRQTTDAAIKLIEQLDITLERAVRVATGQDRITQREEDFRRRVAGPGASREGAREQIESFDTVEGLFGVERKTVDAGHQADLLEFIRRQFLEEGDTAQKRITGAQSLIANLKDRPDLLGLSPDEQQGFTGLSPEQLFVGQELLKALGVDPQKAAQGLGAGTQSRFDEIITKLGEAVVNLADSAQEMALGSKLYSGAAASRERAENLALNHKIAMPRDNAAMAETT